jgi:hypothetical protein
MASFLEAQGWNVDKAIDNSLANFFVMGDAVCARGESLRTYLQGRGYGLLQYFWREGVLTPITAFLSGACEAGHLNEEAFVNLDVTLVKKNLDRLLLELAQSPAAGPAYFVRFWQVLKHDRVFLAVLRALSDFLCTPSWKDVRVVLQRVAMESNGTTCFAAFAESALFEEQPEYERVENEAAAVRILQQREVVVREWPNSNQLCRILAHLVSLEKFSFLSADRTMLILQTCPQRVKNVEALRLQCHLACEQYRDSKAFELLVSSGLVCDRPVVNEVPRNEAALRKLSAKIPLPLLMTFRSWEGDMLLIALSLRRDWVVEIVTSPASLMALVLTLQQQRFYASLHKTSLKVARVLKQSGMELSADVLLICESDLKGKHPLFYSLWSLSMIPRAVVSIDDSLCSWRKALEWTPFTHLMFGEQAEETVYEILLVLRRVCPRMPKDIRKIILALSVEADDVEEESSSDDDERLDSDDSERHSEDYYDHDYDFNEIPDPEDLYAYGF